MVVTWLLPFEMVGSHRGAEGGRKHKQREGVSRGGEGLEGGGG